MQDKLLQLEQIEEEFIISLEQAQKKYSSRVHSSGL
jgi:hypothetical protein